jgi:hypothetical protein
VIVALLALKPIAQQPDLPGRKDAIQALVVASLSLVASVLFSVWVGAYGIWGR